MKFDLKEYFTKNRISYRDHGKNVGHKEINICCIFCGEDGYHLGINIKKEVWHCWKCSENGNIFQLIAEIENCSYKEAVKIINKKESFEILKNKIKDYFSESKEKFTEKSKNIEFSLPKYCKSITMDDPNIFNKNALQYLLNRGISFNIIKQKNLNYCYGGKYKNRIIIPVYFKNKLVNFLGRTWDKKAEKRYLNCANEQVIIPMKQLLYNYDNIINNKTLILTEGIFDCLKVGTDKSIATFGTEVTIAQKQLIINLKLNKLIILFDREAFNISKELANWFNPFIPKVKAIKIEKKDPGEMLYNEISELIDKY